MKIRDYIDNYMNIRDYIDNYMNIRVYKGIFLKKNILRADSEESCTFR